MVEAAVVGRLGALEMLAGRVVVVLLVAVPVVLVRVAEEAVGFVAVEEAPTTERRAVAVVPVVPVAVRFAAAVGEDLGLALLGDAAAVGFAPASASAGASASAVPLVDGSSAGGGEGALTDCSASDWAGSDWVGVGASTCSTTSMVLSASDMLGYLLIVGRRGVGCKSSAQDPRDTLNFLCKYPTRQQLVVLQIESLMGGPQWYLSLTEALRSTSSSAAPLSRQVYDYNR